MIVCSQLTAIPRLLYTCADCSSIHDYHSSSIYVSARCPDAVYAIMSRCWIPREEVRVAMSACSHGDMFI